MNARTTMKANKGISAIVAPSRTLAPQRRVVISSREQLRHAPLTEPSLGHDFGQIPFYPFGRACHSCPPRVQARLAIGQLNDQYEREADWVAEQVMCMPEPRIQRQVEPEEEEEEEESIQAKQVARPATQVGPGVGRQFHALRNGGQPLPQSVRDFFEPRFGHDFSQVRIHTGVQAAEAARQVSAQAFTVGRDMVFGTGHYAPGSSAGRKLIAHELAHTIQQGAAVPRSTGHVHLQRLPIPTRRTGGLRLQRQPCPTGVTFSTGNHPAHVPPCGTQPVTAQAQPANIPNLTWSLHNGSAQVDANTSISAQGQISIANSQAAGDITVRATRPASGSSGACMWDQPLTIRSHPTGITSTRVIGPPTNTAQHYGGVFDHVFASHDGNVASLENVAVGERFPNVPNPTAATHPNIPTPFGRFTLTTRTLTANATNNWFLTSAGELGGTHDEVTIDKSIVNVGHFLQSASNPNPTHALPVSFSLDQDLYWYCRTAAAANRWTRFVQTQHVRGLRQSAGNLEFFVSVNRIERTDTYEGHPGIINARAVPNRVARSPAGGPANTVTIRADTLPDPLPAGHALRFSTRGAALGSTVNANTGVFSAGQTAGHVRVRVRDSQASNQNYDETTVTIV